MVPCTVFLPEKGVAERMDCWWFYTPAVLQQMVGCLGFERSTVTYHQQLYDGNPYRLYTIVAERTQPMPRRIDGPYPWY
jgi:hypothetical protein